MQVAVNKIVSLRFRLKNGQGDILEDIMAAAPVDYLHGSGNILPVLEAGIEGLEAGDTKTIVFKDDASQSGGDYIIDVVIDHIREATPAELQTARPISASRGDNCGPGCCC